MVRWRRTQKCSGMSLRRVHQLDVAISPRGPQRLCSQRPGYSVLPRLREETEPVAREYMARIKTGFTTLRDQLHARRPEKVVDYIPTYRALTGLALAYWEATES